MSQPSNPTLLDAYKVPGDQDKELRKPVWSSWSPLAQMDKAAERKVGLRLQGDLEVLPNMFLGY